MSNDDNPFLENDPFAAIVESVDNAKRDKDKKDREERERKEDFLVVYRAALIDIVDKEFKRAINSPTLRNRFADGFRFSMGDVYEDTPELTIMGGRTTRCSLRFELLAELDGFRRVLYCAQRAQKQTKIFLENLSEKVVRESVETFVRYVLEANPKDERLGS